MTKAELENAKRCLKLWIEKESYLQTYKTCLEALEQIDTEEEIKPGSRVFIDIEMPKCCDECDLYDDRWDYPTCYVNRKSSGYNFPVREKRMDFCPLHPEKLADQGEG